VISGRRVGSELHLTGAVCTGGIPMSEKGGGGEGFFSPGSEGGLVRGRKEREGGKKKKKKGKKGKGEKKGEKRKKREGGGERKRGKKGKGGGGEE